MGQCGAEQAGDGAPGWELELGTQGGGIQQSFWLPTIKVQTTIDYENINCHAKFEQLILTYYLYL